MTSFSLSRRCSRLAVLALLLASPAAFAQSRFVVTSPADSGAGTLRDAITQANANADRTTIDFAIDTNAFGPGPWQIALQSSLPEFNAPVIVRGFSQAGTTAPTSTGNGRLMLELSTDGNSDYALMFSRGSEGSSVTGLAFVGGASGSPALLIMAGNVRASANTIGIHADGTPDHYSGIGIGAVCADGIVIGGNTPADGNVFFGTTTAIMMDGANHLVRHNWLGMDLQGLSPLDAIVSKEGLLAGTIGVGVAPHLQSTYTPAVQQSFFGLRDTVIADNRFAHVNGNAIRLLGANNPTRGNQILRNVFGRDIWGGPDAYVDVAVRLSNDAFDNLVSGNTIARANAGILLGDGIAGTTAGNGNRLSRNLIYDVAYPMIGLDAANGFRPLANDPLDADSGANAFQNLPELSAVSTAGGVEGRLDAAANETYTIEFSLATDCHASGYGAADYLLGSIDVHTDASGRAAIASRFPTPPLTGLRAGDAISATATDSRGNTSEFSRCVPLAAAIPTTVKVAPLVTPQPAMDTSALLQAQVIGDNTRVPGGEVTFYARTATGRRELGRAPLQGGLATLNPPAQGFFVNAGHYELEAEYSGDGFHQAGGAAAQSIIVFRPSIATLDITLSAPVRRNLGSGDRDLYEAPGRLWRVLATQRDDTWIDSDRFFGERLDRMLVRDANGEYVLVDERGARAAVRSNAIGSGAQIVDLLQADDDVRADAIVRDPAAGWLLVHCVFVIDNCERAERLPTNLEFDFVLSGEFDGDGFSDLVWRNRASGELEIWFMDGNKPRYRSSLMPPAKDAQLAAAVDINGDGYEDLIWEDLNAKQLYVIQIIAGRPLRTLVGALPSATMQVVGSVQLGMPGQRDYGFGQILLHDTSSGEVVVWRDIRPVAGQVRATPDTLYVDRSLAPERVR